MRLLFIFSELEIGGGGRNWSVLVPALAERGHEPFVLTLDGEGPFFDELRASGVPVHCAWMRRRRDWRALRRALTRVGPRPHAVVTWGPGPQVLGQALAWRFGAPHITVEHRGHEYPFPPHQAATLLLVAPHVHRVVAVTAKQIPRLVQRGHKLDRIRVIHNGLPVGIEPTRPPAATRSELGLGHDDFVALLISRLSPVKRPDLFVRAVLRANRSNPRVHGVLAGSGPERLVIEPLVAGNEGVVQLLGDRSDIPDLIHAADVVCQSSIIESLPTGPLEGMSCGRPIVATSAGGTDEVVVPGETGLLVPPEDELAFAAALLELAADPDLARALGEAGRARQRELFSLDRTADRYAQMLLEARAELDGRRRDAA